MEMEEQKEGEISHGQKEQKGKKLSKVASSFRMEAMSSCVTKWI